MNRILGRSFVAALFMSLVLGTTSYAAKPAAPVFVKRSGTHLTLAGNDYRFTGFNIYNANSTPTVHECWYELGTGTALDQSLADIGSGNEAFRAWFFQSFATKNGTRDWSAMDHTVAVAKARGVRVIATLGNQWGDCEEAGRTPDERFKAESWYRMGYKQLDPAGSVSYRDWVKEVVNRYKKDPTILAWQLLNEAEVKPYAGAGICSIGAAGILRAWASDISTAIKRVDANHLVSLGTIGDGQCGTANADYETVHSLPTIDLCEYHDYHPTQAMPGDEWNGLQVRLGQCGRLNKPLFVGEVGVKPTDVGDGTYQARADAFRAKLNAQFAAGVVGELAWAWSALGSLPANYDIGPGDPTIAVFGDATYN